MSFNAAEYQRCFDAGWPADEQSIRLLVEECGGAAGEVETGKSELVYHEHRLVRTSRYLPVYHAEDFDRRVPVETVFLGSEMECV